MSREVVTLGSFASRVGCHFTTVSRLKSGDRLPGRELLGRIVDEYSLDPEKALKAYVSGRSAFATFLQDNVFEKPKESDADDISHQRVPAQSRVAV